MIAVKLVNDYEKTKKLFLDNNIEYNPSCYCMCAADGDEIISSCLFEYTQNCVIIKAILPLGDILMGDGVLRSTLFVATNHGKTEAFYDNDELEVMLEKLEFIENKQERRIKINKIFETCTRCAK